MDSEILECYNNSLREASENGYLEIVKYLSNNGADINSLKYYTHIIAQNGHLDILKYLVKEGINLRYENDRPLRSAAEEGQLDVVKYLVNIGLDVNSESDYCIRKASENDHLNVVKYLIEKGSPIKFIRNPEIRDKLGIPKWYKKPNNLEFRITDECSISGERLNKNVRQLGCSSCRNVFKLEALEHWLNINYKCPHCSSSDEFYLVYY